MNAVSRVFVVPAPAVFRCRRMQPCIAETSRKLDMGRITLAAAVKKIESVCGSDEPIRHMALSVMHPHKRLYDHFRHTWLYNGFGEIFEPPLGCPAETFHRAMPRIFNVVTEFMADAIVPRIAAMGEAFVSFRSCNDFKYENTSVGVAGLSARNSTEVFLIWPYTHPNAASRILEAAKGKPLHCVNAKKAQEKFGDEFEFVDLALERRANDDAFDPMKRVLQRAVGVAHCRNHCYDVFVNPAGVTNLAVRHLAAELYFLSRCGEA